MKSIVWLSDEVLSMCRFVMAEAALNRKNFAIAFAGIYSIIFREPPKEFSLFSGDTLSLGFQRLDHKDKILMRE